MKDTKTQEMLKKIENGYRLSPAHSEDGKLLKLLQQSGCVKVETAADESKCADCPLVERCRLTSKGRETLKLIELIRNKKLKIGE